MPVAAAAAFSIAMVKTPAHLKATMVARRASPAVKSKTLDLASHVATERPSISATAPADALEAKQSLPDTPSAHPHTPSPCPSPSQARLGSLPLYSVRIRKRMQIGEGALPQRLRPNSLSQGERVGVRGDALAILAESSLGIFCPVSPAPRLLPQPPRPSC